MAIVSLGLAGCVPHEAAVRHLRYAVWGQVRQVAIERAIAAAFEQTHPDVKIDLVTVTADYQSKLQSMMVGGAAPDVMMIDELSYADWSSRGTLLDLTDLVDEIDHDSPLMPAVLSALSIRGRYYAVPINCHGLVMYCNLDALRRVGVTLPDHALTWNEFVALGPKLARRGGASGSSTEYLCAAPPPTTLFQALGGQIFDDPHHPQEVRLNNAGLVKAIGILRRLSSRGWMPSAASQMDSGSFQLFRDGKAAFLLMWRSIVPELIGHVGFHWDVAPVPLEAGGIDRLGGTFIGVSRTSPEPELARAFARFYASKTAVDLAVSGGRVVPVQRALAYGPDFLSQPGPPSMRRFSETMEANHSGYLIYTPGVREVFNLCARREQQALAEPEIPAEEIVARLRSDLENWLTQARHGAGLGQ